jgi:hypothetical protein
MEAVITANAKWRPAFLYMDEGFGNTNIELLQKYGHDMMAKNLADPACALKDHLVRYDFGSKVEIYDPVTQQPVKKDAKPFMVQNAVRRFEENTIKISAFDTALIRQLENYIIDHRTPTGRPTYGLIDKKIGDHRLDAFMLSLVAFKLEMSDFAKPHFSAKIALSAGFGEKGHRPADEIKRLRRVPGDRYDLDEVSFTSQPILPGRVSNYRFKSDRICSQEAWATDREEEFRRKWEIKQLKKRLRRRKAKPERSNI